MGSTNNRRKLRLKPAANQLSLAIPVTSSSPERSHSGRVASQQPSDARHDIVGIRGKVGMSHPPEELKIVDFSAEQQRLKQEAHDAPAKRAGSTLYRGDGLRQTMVAIVADAEMTEHDSPAEAFIHVLEGQVTIHGDNRQWQISAGNLFPIPPEKHSVTADQNSVFTLTVLRK